MPNLNRQFLKACQNQPKEALKSLLALSTINVNISNRYGQTPLHFAVVFNHIGLITTLLERGADPNAQNDAGNTPLHKAVRNSNAQTISLLLSAGARLELKNLKEQTPINVAELYGYTALAKAIQLSYRLLETKKQQALVRMEMLKQAIAEQDQLITNYEEMIRQQEYHLQGLKIKIQFSNFRLFEQLQTSAPPASLAPPAKRQKTIAASPFFEDATSKNPLIPQASKSADITSSQSAS